MSGALPLLFWPRAGAALTILFYHRVLAAPDPLRPGEIDARAFDVHMRLVARHLRPLPLIEATRRLDAGTLPARACCVTFDDGYADNLHVALPILERHGVPATVFVATGYLDGGRMFNDTLTELVARARGPRLDLTGARLGRHDLDGAGARVAAVRSLLEQAKRLAPEERAARIAAAAAAVGAADLPDDLMLTSAQVRELADRGVEIGAHTATHAILTTLDPAGAEREITVSRRRLEEITGRAVRTFAYPNGIPGRDYAREHSELVRQLGFACAVTTARGVATAATDRFQLPRFQPWTGSPFKLAAHLMRNARAGGALAQA